MSKKKYSDLNDLEAMLEDLQEEDKRLNNIIIDLTNLWFHRLLKQIRVNLLF